jgi:hypothetical protein
MAEAIPMSGPAIEGGVRAPRRARKMVVAVATATLCLFALLTFVAASAASAGADTLQMDGSTDAYAPMLDLSSLFAQSSDLGSSGPNPEGVAVQQADPGAGSCDAVNELEGQGQDEPTLNAARTTQPPQGYCRSTTGQNFEALGVDGLDWEHPLRVNNAKTPSWSVQALTQSQLIQIYTGTLSCSTRTGTLDMNWKCLGGTNAPIYCMTQSVGEPEQVTWFHTLALSTSTVPACALNVSGPESQVIPEDDVGAINSEGGTNGRAHFTCSTSACSTLYGSTPVIYPAKDYIFFASYGKFSIGCSSVSGYPGGPTARCPLGTSHQTAVGVQQLGEMPSTVTGNPIPPSVASLQGSGGGEGTTWPVLRYLFNAYNNSSETNDPNVAGNTQPYQDTLNFVSEYGFLCKDGTQNETDPSTGTSYRSEIEETLVSNGWWPLDASPSSPFQEGTLADPAVITDPNYQAIDPEYGESDPYGYCLSITG